MKVSAPHRGWTSGRATPSLRPAPMRQRQQTRQDATYRSRKSVQTTAASSVVGFSRMASAEEDGTLARLRALRGDLIDPTVAAHNGRVFKRTGDGVLIEFRSVVAAVRCAIAVQNSMVERFSAVPLDRRIVFRI